MPNAPAATGSWRAGYLQRLFRHAPSDHDPVILRHQRIYILPTRRGYYFTITSKISRIFNLFGTSKADSQASANEVTR